MAAENSEDAAYSTPEQTKTPQELAKKLGESGIAKMTAHMDGLHGMTAAELARQIGEELIGLVGKLVQELEKDGRWDRLQKQLAADTHEQEKANRRHQALKDYREYCEDYSHSR